MITHAAPAQAAAILLFLLSSLCFTSAAEEAANDADGAGQATTEVEEFTDDLIILKSELAIEGRVIHTTPTTVYVEVDYGVLQVPRSKIRAIELNFASRLKDLPADDHMGRYNLAVQALENGSVAQARTVFEALLDKEGIPPEIHLKLAGIYEREGDLEKSLKQLEDLKLKRPGDQALQLRIDELNKRMGKTPGGGGAQEPVAAAAVVEGLEVGMWTVQSWGNKANISVQDSKGNKMLGVDIPAGGTQDKTAFARSGSLDLSGKSKLGFKAYNAGTGRVNLALALVTAAGYYESRPIALNPNWNTDLSMDLVSKSFKCKETNWRYETAVEGLEKVNQLMFLVYCGKRKALIYLDEVIAK